MNIGKIIISQELLLQWLQFVGGEIIDIRMDNFSHLGQIEILIKHEEMPPAQAGFCVQVNPVYTSEYGENGHLIRVTREPLFPIE